MFEKNWRTLNKFIRCSGMPMKPGGRQESILSSSPLTDSAVMNEMKKADQRCVQLSKEIEQLKQEIAVLSTVNNSARLS